MFAGLVPPVDMDTIEAVEGPVEEKRADELSGLPVLLQQLYDEVSGMFIDSEIGVKPVLSSMGIESEALSREGGGG